MSARARDYLNSPRSSLFLVGVINCSKVLAHRPFSHLNFSRLHSHNKQLRTALGQEARQPQPPFQRPWGAQRHRGTAKVRGVLAKYERAGGTMLLMRKNSLKVRLIWTADPGSPRGAHIRVHMQHIHGWVCTLPRDPLSSLPRGRMQVRGPVSLELHRLWPGKCSLAFRQFKIALAFAGIS